MKFQQGLREELRFMADRFPRRLHLPAHVLAFYPLIVIYRVSITQKSRKKNETRHSRLVALDLYSALSTGIIVVSRRRRPRGT